MRRVVPLLVTFALVSGCVAEESTDENIGSSYQRVTLLEEGVYLFEGQVAPGEDQAAAFETNTDTLQVSAQILQGTNVAVRTIDNGVPDDNAYNCTSETSCTELLPGDGAVGVSAKNDGSTTTSFTVEVKVIKFGISTSPAPKQD